MARVLVIEDDKIIARTIQIVLTSAGHQVQIQSTGEDGVAEVAANEPDLLITDVSLPGMDGIEAFQKAREAAPGLKVIAISGSEASLERAKQGGADIALEKPFSSQDFLDAIESLVGGKD